MEARIYKPKRWRNGKRVIGRLYRARIKLQDENRVRDVALKVSDRQVAQQKLIAMVRELEQEAQGMGTRSVVLARRATSAARVQAFGR
jgi:hypothetical protein